MSNFGSDWSSTVKESEWAISTVKDKGRYWPSLEGPWSKKTKGCNEIPQMLHGTGTTPSIIIKYLVSYKKWVFQDDKNKYDLLNNSAVKPLHFWK